MQHGIVLKKLNLYLLTPRVREGRRGGGGGGGLCEQNICYHVATFRDSHKFDMQHDHVLKKLNFDLVP